MADRYWVGGTASWDGTAGTKWATTSGGAGGASVPTSADAVFFDANSGASTVTIATGNTGALSINCTGFVGTLAGSAAITVSGSVTLVAGMTYTFSGNITLNATATITSAGKTLGQVTVNGSGITVTLGDALNLGSNALFVTQGTFTTANFNITAGSLISNGATARTINLGSSTLTFSQSQFIDFLTSTNLTLNAGTSQINASSTSAEIRAGGKVFYNVAFTSTTAGTRTIFSAETNSTFNNLTVTGPSSAGVVQVVISAPQVIINGTLSTTGTAGNCRVWFRGATYGLAQTLTINSAPSLTDADFRDIYVIGTAAPISGTRIGDLRGCRGITFSTPKNCYRIGSGDWSENQWSNTSGGSVSTDNFPLAQDTAIINQSSTSPLTLNTVITYTGAVDFSARTSAFTFNTSNSWTFYGSLTLGSGVTTNGTSTQTFSGRNTQVITSAGKTLTFPITIDSYGGSVELADALNIGSNNLTVTNGTFDTKNFNVTAGSLSSSNSNVRTITLGSSTVTLDQFSAIAFGTITNLTLNAGTSTINISASTPVVAVGAPGVTFYNVAFTSTASGDRSFNGAGINTINNLTVNATAAVGVLPFFCAANQTITGTLTVAGASPVRRIFVRSNTLGTQRTLNVGTLSATDCDFRDIAITGAAAGSSPTRAGDCGGNSGITFPAGKTVYWNLAGAQNWSATGWATSSGGAPAINNFPLAQDTAVFDNAGAAGTVTADAAWNIGTLNASARTSAMTLAPFSSFIVYGNWSLGTGITTGSNASNTALTFVGRGTQAITSNGVTFNHSITIDNFSGTVQLADALTLASNRILILTSGAFNAVTYNVTLGQFDASNSNVRTLRMGSGTWTLSGTGGVWTTATTTNLVFYKGTANIVLSDTSTTARSFAGGLSYNKLTIGGTTGTSTLTITGDNQFTELASTKTVAHTIALGTTTQTFGKWTVTGTVGNVVTLTGTGTSHILAGACTSGIDYLAMGSIGFAATSPGEFYAGANSTATAAVAPVYLTAKPADSTRYWVGGTGNWSSTTKWSTSSGGASGASVPRSHDDVIFNSASNATAYTATVDAVTGGIRMKSLTIAGPASGNVTLAGSAAMVGIHGNVTLPATGLTRTYTGGLVLSGSTTGYTFTTNGVALTASGADVIQVNGVGCEWTLGSSADLGVNSGLNVVNGSFLTANYSFTTAYIRSDNSNKRSISLGSSVVSMLGFTDAFRFGTTESIRADLTFSAGTSQVNMSQPTSRIFGNDQTFYNIAFTSTSAGTVTINGTNSFTNLSFTGITSAGLKVIDLTANQTVTGTLTFSAGTDATMRHFCRSDTIGTTRTITAAAVSMTDVDFRDVTIAGAAAPASGTRIGDCKGNSGITFTAATTRYWNLAAGGNWSATGWAATSGGAPAVNNFPLAQDTCVFEATGLNSGATVTVNAGYNIGTINMSARTANTMTLATSTNALQIYGNWINGTGTSISGTGVMTFAGRGSQTITSAGKTFTQPITVHSPSGSVTLQDAYTSSSTTGLTFNAGTFDANGFNVTLTNGGIVASATTTKTIAFGSGTWVLGSAVPLGGPNTASTTITGTGTISCTSASAKSFSGQDLNYSGITLNQGGAGTLTIGGNNTFKDITNTYKATGATTINMGSTTQRVSQWTAAGEAGRLLTIQGVSSSNPCTLIHTGTGTAANVDYLVITGVRAY